MAPWAYSDSIVYALRCDGGVKIGITTKLSDRLAAVRMHNPLPITVEREAWLPWCRGWWLERELHTRLRAQWIHGEWFASSADEVRMAFIELMPQAMAQPMPEIEKARKEAERDRLIRDVVNNIRSKRPLHYTKPKKVLRPEEVLELKLPPNLFRKEPSFFTMSKRETV